MQKRSAELRQKIIDAAWELFYEKGYEETTVNDIIERAGTSKGGFYYYFSAKDELLNSLYAVFDREYERFYAKMDKNLDRLTQLKQLNHCASCFIDGNVSVGLLAALYESQLAQRTQDNFLSPERYYIQLVLKIIREGQERQQIRDDISAEALTHHVLLLERGIFTDWVVQNGGFSLGYFGSRYFDLYIEFMKPPRAAMPGQTD